MRPGRLTIREAVEPDVPAIHHFIHGLAEHEGRPEACTVTEADLRLHLFGARRYCEVVIAEQEQQSVGLALFFRYYATFAGQPAMYLEDIYVVPERRRHGIGRALMAHVARIAVDEGCARLEWGVVSSNESAIGFYTRLGATVAPRETLGGCLEGNGLQRVAACAAAW